MLWIIIQVFIALSSFSGSLETKCVSLSSLLCMVRPTIIDLNPIEVNYNPFIISLDKCSRRCNAVDGLPTKIYIPSKRKQVFKTIARTNETKTLVKLVILNANSIL